MTTLYWAVYPSSDAKPSAAELIAGTRVPAFTATGTDTAPTTTGAFAGQTITGLAELTEYKIAVVWSDATNNSAVEESAAFTTPAESVSAETEGTGGFTLPSVSFTGSGEARSADGTVASISFAGIAITGTGDAQTEIEGTGAVVALGGTFSAAGIGTTGEAVEGTGTVAFTGLGVTSITGQVSVAVSSGAMTLGAFDVIDTSGTVSRAIEGGSTANLGINGPTISGTGEVVSQILGITVDLFAAAVPQASITDIHVLWWDTPDPTGVPVFETTTASTDGSGQLQVDLNAVTGLAVGETGFLLLWKPDNTTPQDSPAFAGRVDVTSIA